MGIFWGMTMIKITRANKMANGLLRVDGWIIRQAEMCFFETSVSQSKLRMIVTPHTDHVDFEQIVVEEDWVDGDCFDNRSLIKWIGENADWLIKLAASVR